jgi:hypothetical protein
MKFKQFLENPVSPSVNLSNHQKMVLAKIIAAPETGASGKKVALTTEKLQVAKGALVQLGLITVNEITGFMRVTPKAVELMREDGLVDESGALTDAGQDYAVGKTPDPAVIQQQQNAPTAINQGAQPITTVTGTEQQPRVGESIKASFKQFLVK